MAKLANLPEGWPSWGLRHGDWVRVESSTNWLASFCASFCAKGVHPPPLQGGLICPLDTS